MTTKKMTLTAIVLFLAVTGVVQALVRLGGSQPIGDQGWPAGSVRMANLRTRISWRAGEQFRTGGMYEFEYHAENTEQFNEALEIFAAIDANRLELIVHSGPRIGYSRRDKSSQSKDRIDWTFTVWNPGDRNNRNNPPGTLLSSGLVPISKGPVPPPTIDVHIGGGAVVWEQVKVPENVVLIDKRPESVSPEFEGKGLIRAEVFDMETKKPIPAARIVLLKAEGPGEFKLTKQGGETSEKGFCQIAYIPLSFYELRVLADGYVARKWGYWDNERPEFLQFKIGLSRPACVAGIVIDTDGKPVKGASLWVTDVLGSDGLGYSCVDEPTSTADEQGRFEMCSLPKGSMSPRCRFEGLHFTNSILDQHKVPSGGIRLVMIGTGTIWGKVVDRKGNKPTGETILELEAEGVRKPGTWYYGSHGYKVSDGTFNISGIPPGRYVISVRPNPGPTEYEPNIGKITVEAGKTYEMEVLYEDLRDRAMNKVRKFIERQLNHDD